MKLINILDYDPAWPGKFQTHAGRIAQALGKVALRNSNFRRQRRCFTVA